MTDKESANALIEINVKLCAAVKKHRCLYEQKSCSSTLPEYIEAWKLVAKECNLHVDFCKKRWQTLRKCFFEGLRSPENKYYFHDHLKFLQGGFKGKTEVVETLTEEPKPIDSKSFAKRQQNEEGVSLKGSEVKSMHTTARNYAKSVSSCISTDDSDEVLESTEKSGSVTINLSNEELLEVNEERLKRIRSRKRPLQIADDDDGDDDELIKDVPEAKRCQESKTSKSDHKSQLPNKSIKVRLKKLKIMATENEDKEPAKPKMAECCSQTEVKTTKDVATQYELYSTDLDDIFINVIKTNLFKMNARQKMNFKRKIYQSMLEVFDDATDFPSNNDTAPLVSKQTPVVDDTTTGEMRLIRELVSLIHAAKSTPEIINATDKVRSESPLKMPVPIVDKASKDEKSPLSLSPCAEDDDLQFFIDNLDDEDDVSLPLSWNELKTKTAEPVKELKEDKSNGSPRYMVRKVVKASTLGANSFDKKRVICVFPKLASSNGNHVTLSKIGEGAGPSLPTTSNNLQVPKKKYGIGTFYIAKPQNTSKVGSSVSNITARALNNKPTNQTSNPMNISRRSISSSSVKNASNSQTVFKTVHPENRILCSTTGYFQTINTKATDASKHAQRIFAGPAGLTTKVMTTKLPIIPRLSEISGPRSSGSTSEEERNLLKSNKTADSSVMQLHISDPRSLNNAAINDESSSSKKFSSNMSSKTTAIVGLSSDDDTKTPLRALSTTLAKEREETPILKTAGTVETDNLQPVVMKTLQVKTEPVDN